MAGEFHIEVGCNGNAVARLDVATWEIVQMLSAVAQEEELEPTDDKYTQTLSLKTANGATPPRLAFRSVLGWMKLIDRQATERGAHDAREHDTEDRRCEDTHPLSPLLPSMDPSEPEYLKTAVDIYAAAMVFDVMPSPDKLVEAIREYMATHVLSVEQIKIVWERIGICDLDMIKYMIAAHFRHIAENKLTAVEARQIKTYCHATGILADVYLELDTGAVPDSNEDWAELFERAQRGRSSTRD